jgi:hypothetical protein
MAGAVLLVADKDKVLDLEALKWRRVYSLTANHPPPENP